MPGRAFSMGTGVLVTVRTAQSTRMGRTRCKDVLQPFPAPLSLEMRRGEQPPPPVFQAPMSPPSTIQSVLGMIPLLMMKVPHSGVQLLAEAMRQNEVQIPGLLNLGPGPTIREG